MKTENDKICAGKRKKFKNCLEKKYTVSNSSANRSLKWLKAFPKKRHSFSLTKFKIGDGIALIYEFDPKKMQSKIAVWFPMRLGTEREEK